MKYARSSFITAMIFYGLLTVRNIFFSKLSINKNLKTGNRLENVNQFSRYLDFCRKHVSDQLKCDGESPTALEIGPGDNHALALSVLARGFHTVETIDKFQRDYSDQRLLPLYCAVFGNDNIGSISAELKKIHRLQGIGGLAALANTRFHNRYDFIYSVSVLEHIWPLDQLVTVMLDTLKRGGSMQHVVNFTDHGMFSPNLNRFGFRKIPGIFYNPIMKPAGRPNRYLPSELRKLFEVHNAHVEIKVLKTHTRILLEEEQYCLASIPETELKELLEIYKLDPELNKNIIMDMCIGSAVFTVFKK